MKLRTRIAPTPSGYLHLGNAVNFLITAAITKASQGHLHLRIDDLDHERVKPRYVEDIFYQLEYLEIEPHSGPGSVAEVDNYSQKNRMDIYMLFLNTLAQNSALFGCACSRKENFMRNEVLYSGLCREKSLGLEKNLAWRFSFHNSSMQVPDCMQQKAKPNEPIMPGNFVVRRKDGLPSYQLASLADDVSDEMNYIVRGKDLLYSTACQLALVKHLGGLADSFNQVQFYHHELLCDSSGNKLSKSQKSSSLQEFRNAGGNLPYLVKLASEYLGVKPSHSLKELAENLPSTLFPGVRGS